MADAAPHHLYAPLQKKRRWRKLLKGCASQRTFARAARHDRATVSTTVKNGELRTAAVTKAGLELGYYLVRLPNEPTPGTDAALAASLHADDPSQLERDGALGCAKVAAGVAVFVEPAARGRKLGEVLFREAMRACRRLGFGRRGRAELFLQAVSCPRRRRRREGPADDPRRACCVPRPRRRR